MIRRYGQWCFLSLLWRITTKLVAYRSKSPEWVSQAQIKASPGLVPSGRPRSESVPFLFQLQRLLAFPGCGSNTTAPASTITWLSPLTESSSTLPTTTIVTIIHSPDESSIISPSRVLNHKGPLATSVTFTGSRDWGGGHYSAPHIKKK